MNSSTTSSETRARASGGPSLLRDQLSQFDQPKGPPTDVIASTRTIFAWLLTLCGLGVGGWVVYIIHRAIFNPTSLGLPLKILKAEDLVITMPSGKIEIPPAAATVVGYLLLVFLLAIAAKIATALISQGAGLLRENKPKES
jgi:hypothetical protein